jgi:transcriptional regulator with XRE-family HTH domain
MGQVIRQRRSSLGLSQGQLATKAGVDARQIRRYESGEQQPVLSVAVAIADALGIPLAELAGQPSRRLDLLGDWIAIWQSYRNGQEAHRVQPVRFGPERGDVIEIEAMARGDEIAKGGYLWKGELRLWDNEILIGWYVAIEGSIRSKGALYYTIHPHGQQITGRWVGLSHDGQVITGWATMGKTQPQAEAAMASLNELPEPAS